MSPKQVPCRSHPATVSRCLLHSGAEHGCRFARRIRGRLRCYRSTLGSTLRPGLCQVDLPGEHRVLLNRKPPRVYITNQICAGAQLHATGRCDVAIQAAQHNHIPRGYVGLDLWFGPIVSRLSVSVIVPSTRPSTRRSSLPLTSPRICTDFPIVAGVPTVSAGDICRS